jgi:parallel beta-helix repeat protein
MRMAKKEKKKSWKEIQRERQIKQQRAQEAYQIQSEKEAKKKPRQWPKGKIFLAVCLIAIIFGTYGAWQYTNTAAPSDGNTPVTPTVGVIYIKPDGQVSPSTAPISNDGNSHYTLTANIADPIIIGKNNIVIDGANHLIQGTGELGSSGIDLTGRSDVTVTNFKITGFDYGIYLSGSSNNVISQNDLTNNYCGIWIVSSSNDNTVSDNSIENNEMYAIWLKESSNNKISKNEITAHGNYTMYVRASNFTTFSANNIEDNRLGVFFYEASDNILYHNNFINNMNPYASTDSTNVWDNGSSGNYWSDYTGIYPEAEESNGLGIWDIPYVIDDYNQDNYPLINWWTQG